METDPLIVQLRRLAALTCSTPQDEWTIPTLGVVLARADAWPGELGRLARALRDAVPCTDSTWHLPSKEAAEQWWPDAAAPAGSGSAKGATEVTEQRTASSRDPLGTVEAALRSEGRPLSTEKLLCVAKVQLDRRALKELLSLDERFTRASRRTWALADWGRDVYKSPGDLIGELVDAHGGQVPVAEVVRVLTDDYGYQENSAKNFISQPPFTSRNGFVRRRGVLGTRKETSRPSPLTADHAPSVDDLIDSIGLDR
ncbi:hypothetical protein ACFVFQ_26685 [Streptomyces sp. NPDC057743]|uniref:hypothetical protein n=1 Tax=Streptomyces sp. NPDC057743 TaxID=3346236 RepID=UPI00367B592E